MSEQFKAPFKVGDTVRHKSGGPAMAIEKIKGKMAHCSWFAPLGDVSTGNMGAPQAGWKFGRQWLAIVALIPYPTVGKAEARKQHV